MRQSHRVTTRASDRWLLIGWIAIISLALAGTIHDTDPYWQIRAGTENLEGVPLARPDSWSWAPVEGLFRPNSPAWNVLLAITWHGAGWWGLYAVTVASIASCLAIVVWLATRLRARALPTLFGLLVCCAAALPLFSPRAALPALTLMLAAIAGATAWRRQVLQLRGPLGGLVVLVAGFVVSVVGNWIHLSWVSLAPTTAAAWAAIWVLTPGARARTRIALTVGGTLGLIAGILVGPYGLDALRQSTVVVEACRGLVFEWLSPFDPIVGWLWAVVALAVLTVVLGAVTWCARALWMRSPDPRIPLAAALAIAAGPYALGGLLYVRFILAATIIVAPLVAAGLSELTARAQDWSVARGEQGTYVRRRLPEWTSDGFWRVIAWILLLVLTPLAIFAGSRHARPPTVDVNAALPSGCRLFATTPEAASILLMRPDVRVWFDSRADYWGHARNELAAAYLYRVDQPTLVPAGTTCIVLTEATSDRGLAPLTAALDADPAWQRVPDTVGANVWLPSGT